MMFKIYFKNGTSVNVSQRVMNIIRDRVTEGCGQFQCFLREDNEDAFLIINLSEITHII